MNLSLKPLCRWIFRCQPKTVSDADYTRVEVEHRLRQLNLLLDIMERDEAAADKASREAWTKRQRGHVPGDAT